MVKYLLDGGSGTELTRLGYQNHNNSNIWSGVYLDKDPSVLVGIHSDFYEAGANIVTTASYQISIPGLLENGYNFETSQNLIRRSVELVQIAKQKNSKRNTHTQKIAFSCGPYGAYLADLSEYTGNYKATDSQLAEFHRSRLRTVYYMDEIDFFLFETFPDPHEAMVVLDVLKEFPNIRGRVVFSFTCKNSTQTCSGHSFQQTIIDLFKKDNEYIVGFGVNCCSPKILNEILFENSLRKNVQISTKKQKNLNQILIFGYPNDGSYMNTHEDNISYFDFVKNCLNSDVQVIGGCCHISSVDIAHTKQILDEHNMFI